MFPLFCGHPPCMSYAYILMFAHLFAKYVDMNMNEGLQVEALDVIFQALILSKICSSSLRWTHLCCR